MRGPIEHTYILSCSSCVYLFLSGVGQISNRVGAAATLNLTGRYPVVCRRCTRANKVTCYTSYTNGKKDVVGIRDNWSTMSCCGSSCEVEECQLCAEH